MITQKEREVFLKSLSNIELAKLKRLLHTDLAKPYLQKLWNRYKEKENNNGKVS